MSLEEHWKEIASEYRTEIKQLHKDIEAALDEFEKKMPRSFEKGIGTLDHALCNSEEAIRLLKIRECPIEVKEVKEVKEVSEPEVIDCFEGLL